jgi:hypothetical protein
LDFLENFLFSLNWKGGRGNFLVAPICVLWVVYWFLDRLDLKMVIKDTAGWQKNYWVPLEREVRFPEPFTVNLDAPGQPFVQSWQEYARFKGNWMGFLGKIWVGLFSRAI